MLSTIAIVLPNLKFGGVEKMRLLLAKEWQKKGYRVELVLMRKEGELLEAYNQIDSSVPIYELGVDRISSALLPLARYLRERRPDILLVAMWPLTTLSVMAWLITGCKERIYLSEHTNQSVARPMELRTSLLFMKATVYLSYNLVHGIIAVSQGVKEDLVKTFGIRAERVRVIYNPAGSMVLPELVGRENSGSGDKIEILNILSVGELKDQKKHDLLIRAFAILPSRYRCNLFIVGEGALRGSLEKLIADLGLNDRVFLPGFYLDLAVWYQNSHLFVLSSGWEGFGNVIVEALSFGLPVVSTDCMSGPREILENGFYGSLVPCGDAEALASAMEDALWRAHDKHALRRRSQDFSTEKIANQYLEYFKKLWRSD